MNAYINFGEILSICSQDIERKRSFWHKSRAITLVQISEMLCNNPKLDLVNMNACIKFGEILSICSQDIERKRNF